jgi:PKD repeat protein
MKKIIYIFLSLPLILFSCEKNPVASFSTDSGEQVVGQPVIFNNNSQNCDRFEWDFGDGYASTESSPVHTFTATGSYEVKLKGFSKNSHSDLTSLTLNIVIPTLLEVEVREYYSEDVIPNASIIIYPTLTDWDAQTNSVDEGFTDADGVAVFSNLDPYVYYLDVWEATHDNYTLRSEDVGFIRTPEILPHKINRFIAWVDVATHTKGSAKGARELIIKKLERVSTDKIQPPADGGTENWQALYNRRVNK